MIGIFFALVFATWPSWAVFTSGKAQTKFATSYAAAPHQLWWAQGGEERGSSDHEKNKGAARVQGLVDDNLYSKYTVKSRNLYRIDSGYLDKV